MSESRGRPRVYAKLIETITAADGWVVVCFQANRTAPSGFRSRYPKHDFRIIATPGELTREGHKPYILQARLRDH